MSGKLIGLTGLAGAGKDEAAKALIADGWVRDAFADRMRKAMLDLDPWLVEWDGHPVRLSQIIAEEGWDQAKRNYPEVRRLLQRFGTEAGRDIHGVNCWVNALFRDWSNETWLVITDCRFDNEAQAVRERGGIVVRIERPGLERLPGGHASEAGVADELVDYVIDNDGTVSQLHARIREIAGWLA